MKTYILKTGSQTPNLVLIATVMSFSLEAKHLILVWIMKVKGPKNQADFIIDRKAGRYENYTKLEFWCHFFIKGRLSAWGNTAIGSP